jgi:hypothetical protein
MANHRKRKNFIRSLNRGDCLLTSQEDKLQEAHRHFLEILGTRGGRNSVVRWENLGYSPFELSELDTMINDDEIRNAVMGMHSEKAPGPDGFIGLFYEDCFEVIREDLSKAINDFYLHKCKSLHLINEANIVLIPKRENPDRIDLFRPISLIDSCMKIITKIMATRLAPRMDEIVSTT